MDIFSDNDQQEYITLRSPYSDAEVQDIFKAVEQHEKPGIDGKVLSVMLQMAYWCALKKGELLAFRIKDVFDADGKPLKHVTVHKDQIAVPDELNSVLGAYWDYLNKLPKYKTGRLSPLFPDFKTGLTYVDHTFDRHIKTICRKLKINPKIKSENIRQAGICRYYASLKESRHTPDECLQTTVQFARRSENQTIGILTDNIQPGGQRRTRPDWEE
ncbi:hypothetical protein ACFL43_01815 [Thermodesulfobacteriota bacterium]